MNEVLQTIAKRYSCRDFLPDMPPDEVLSAIARAAVQAPSGMNRQAWRVVVLKDKGLMDEMEAEGLAGLAAREDKTMYNRIAERGNGLFYGAPCMIVVPIDPAQYAPALVDCGILCQNIALAAASLGVANLMCGLAGLAFLDREKGEAFEKRLGFPEGYAFGCSVLLGYARTEREPHVPDMKKISFVE